MITELSILIPVYNFDVRELVLELLKQGRILTERFEICLYDDGSEEYFRSRHRELNLYPEVRYVEMLRNLGRSALRNRLAKDANFAWLLFLDNDSGLPDSDFLKRYWNCPKNCDVLIGGTIYQPQPPSDLYMLRWRYGCAREARSAADRNKHPYQSLTLNNMLIRRQAYLSHPLSTDLKGYGHEDTKFGWDLEKSGATVCHLDNPVIHLGLEPAIDFLKKTQQGVRNLYQLYRQQGRLPDSKLVRAYELLQKARLAVIFRTAFRQFLPNVLRNLKSTDPSLRYFDLYKLYLFVKLAHPEKE